MDADLSHAPEYLPAFLEALGSADVVIGSRYVEGGGVDERWSRRRQILSAYANLGITAGGRSQGPRRDIGLQGVQAGDAGRPGPGWTEVQRVRVPGRGGARVPAYGRQGCGASDCVHGAGGGQVQDVMGDYARSALEAASPAFQGSAQTVLTRASILLANLISLG